MVDLITLAFLKVDLYFIVLRNATHRNYYNCQKLAEDHLLS